MRRNILISILIIIAILIIIFGNMRRKENYKEEKTSVNEEIIEIGKKYIKEQYPDAFSSWETTSFEAIELEDRWRVNNVVEREQTDEQNNTIIVKGGEVYVEFRKDNKEIIRIGIDD